MKVYFDEKADAIYLKLNDVEIIDSEEVTPGVILDFDKDDQVVGIGNYRETIGQALSR